MSRNSLKRTLALGSASAIAFAGLVAAPAHAAASLTVAPSAGTGANVLSSDDFGLKVYGNTDLSFAQFANLKWEISNPNSLTLAVSSNATSESQSGTTTVVVSLTGAKTDGTLNTLAVDPAITTDASETLSARAFIDVDGDGAVSSADIVSNSFSFTFLGAADVAPAVVFADPVAGNKAKATATIAGLNYDQTTGSNLKAIFIENAVAEAAASFAVNADKDGLEVSSSAASAAGDIWGVKVQAYDYETNALEDVTSAVYRSTVSSDADAATLEMTKSRTVKGATDGTEYTVVGTFDALYATTEKTINAVATFKDGGVVVGAGVPVTVKISEDANAGADSLTDGITLKAGGETLTTTNNAVDSVSYLAYTDANGQVAIEVVASAATDGEHFFIEVTSGTGTADIAVGWDDRAVAAITEVSAISGVRQVIKGGSIPTVRYEVTDNYGAAFVDADGTYRVRVVASGASGATVTDTTPYAGSAVSFALVDNSTATGALTLTAHLEKLNAATPPAYAAIAAGAVTTTSTFEVAASFSAVSTITADTFTTKAGPAKDAAYVAGTTADIGLTLEAYEAVDARANTNFVTTNTLVVGGMLYLEGVAKDATGAIVPGAPVTISAAGVAFKSGDVYSANSITLNADVNGAYTVYAYSNQAGAKTLTVTSGAASKTASVEFAAAGPNTGTDLSISVEGATPGSTMTVTGLLVDKFGNPVKSGANGIAVTYTGPGFTVGDLPTITDADGEFTFKVLLGSNDVISGSVTAVYAGANGTVGTGDDDVTATANLVTEAASSAVATWTKNLNDGTVKMYAKNIVGAGKVQFMLNGAEVAWVRAVDGTDPKLRSANGFYYLVRTVELVEGQKNVLEIYVDGVRTTRTAYSY